MAPKTAPRKPLKKTRGVKTGKDADTLQLIWPNGTQVHLARDGNDVAGVRQVRVANVLLRNPKRLWRPIITTTQGIHYHRFVLRDVRKRGEQVTVVMDAIGTPVGIQEEQDEYLGDVIDLSLPDHAVTGRLEWEFRASELELDGLTFRGFAYRYRFDTGSADHKLYRIFDDATWEIGGRLQGNTLLLQGQSNPPVVALHKKDFFTTACNYYGAELVGVMGVLERVSFQRLPRIGTLQAFDLLIHQRGALLGKFDAVDELLTVVQTAPGEDYLHVLDEIRRPLGRSWSSGWKHMLFLPAPAEWSRQAQRDLWARAYDLVHHQARERAGIAPSPILPRVWIPQVDSDDARLGDARFERTRTLSHLADHVLPKWADMGVKEICTHSLWKSDYTLDRLLRKDERGGMHGALVVGSICNVREHEIAPLWGGLEGLAYFTKRAHELGMQVQIWWATHMCVRARLLQEHPEYALLARDGLPNGGGYGHQGPITLDLNQPGCFEHFYRTLKAIHDATGIDGVFHDSYGNCTFLPMNYRDPLRRGQQQAYERLVAKLQQAGIKTFTVEGLGPYGVGHFGMDLLATDPAGRVGYQNALDWWIGEEDMMYGLNMGMASRIWPGREKEACAFNFRCMAFGGRFGFSTIKDGVEHWDGWLRDHNRVYARIAPLRGRRTILPDDRGVLWRTDDGRHLLFAFQSFDHPCAARAHRITCDGETTATISGSMLRTEPWSVYHLTDGPDPTGH